MTEKSKLDAIDGRLHRAFRVMEVVLGVALLFTISLNFVNVVARQVFSYSMMSAYEVQIYTTVWMIFLGAAAVTLRGEHLRMDALLNLFPKWLTQVLHVLELLLLLALSVFMIAVSASYVLNQAGTYSMMARIPMVVPHSAVLAGYALIALIALRHMLRGGRP